MKYVFFGQYLNKFRKKKSRDVTKNTIEIKLTIYCSKKFLAAIDISNLDASNKRICSKPLIYWRKTSEQVKKIQKFRNFLLFGLFYTGKTLVIDQRHLWTTIQVKIQSSIRYAYGIQHTHLNVWLIFFKGRVCWIKCHPP